MPIRRPGIRKHCERGRARFVEVMGNPANFGMAKSLVAGAGGIVPGGLGSDEDVDALLSRIAEQYPGPGDDADDTAGSPRIGPVRLPDDDTLVAAAAAAPLPGTIPALADYCAAPGRALTATGNLRLADARHLVEALSTGDDPTFDGTRKLTSADELPELSWLLHVAVESGAVRRHQGKLVAVARFPALDDVTAHDKVFRAALDSGLGTRQVPILAG